MRQRLQRRVAEQLAQQRGLELLWAGRERQRVEVRLLEQSDLSLVGCMEAVWCC
jgi:hypothetical protein